MSFKDEILSSYAEAGRHLLRTGAVGEIEFSGSTYQVQIHEGEEEYWPFLQFESSGELRDGFCTCDQASGLGCRHLAAALLYIVGEQGEPLHVRFERSLWNTLCQLFGDRQGYGTKILEKERRGLYLCRSITGKQLFAVEAHTEEATRKLEAMIESRVAETEENSLKFSGLSHEEIALWREGRPTPRLRYELSFWADLAKWLFSLQVSGASCNLDFGYANTGLPNEIRADLGPLHIAFYVAEANLEAIIPGLATVDSPLHVYNFQDDAIAYVRYHADIGELEIVPKESLNMEERLGEESRRQQSKEAIALRNWIFLPNDGFYSCEEHFLLRRTRIPATDIGSVLTEHAYTLARHLQGCTLYLEPASLHYELHFDAEWVLHIHAYLFEPGDLSFGHSRLFGDWLFLDDDGFYPLIHSPFRRAHTQIPPDHITAFIHNHRTWLNSIPSFQTHISVIDSTLTYRLDENDNLRIESRLELDGEMAGAKDFGEWVYVAGEGFFARPIHKRGAPVRAGAVVSQWEIPLFLKSHRDELELIQGFFADSCPVMRATLSILLRGEDKAAVTPQYTLQERYRSRTVRFFGEFSFVEGEGFYELPSEHRLPLRFRSPILLEGKELELFLAYELEGLHHSIGHLDPRLQRPESLSLVVADAQRGEGALLGFLSLNIAFQSEVGQVELGEVWRGLRNGQRYLFSSAGLLDLHHSRFQWLRQLPPTRFERLSGEVRVTALEFLKLSAVEKLECGTGERARRAEQLLDAFASFKPPEEPNIEGLDSSLRHYQAIGVSWLWFLYHHGLSGLLCDDMGLGKTHQAMALMAAIANQFSCASPEDQPYYLVVCPTSVLYHWRSKLERFLPGRRLLFYYGPGRSLEGLEQCDVLLTSYGIARMDREKLSKIPFELAVYDEAQVAKNHNSQTYMALDKLQARMRLGLTGTPIENNLRELKALFDLVLPGYLPNEARFRDEYILPIEKQGDPHSRAQLHRIVRPFLLRRKKEEVLTELPDKTEEKMLCELHPDQSELYKEVMGQQRDKLLHDLENEATPVPYLHVFALLSAMKQICDHPAVWLKKPALYKEYHSGKWRLFLDLLGQARESGQKVVVFSHYLSMLDIIEMYLRECGIGYAAIRGGTARREEELRRFDEDPNCEVFVGSLQATGLGIDLTAASVVIHYDRWWNEARERQATDRVYRIGQTRGVQVFKLITVGTVEEHIDRLIESKGELMEEVVGSDDQSQLKRFTREELMELLA